MRTAYIAMQGRLPYKTSDAAMAGRPLELDLRSILVTIALLGIFAADLMTSYALYRIAVKYPDDRLIREADIHDFMPMVAYRLAVYSGLGACLLTGILYVFSGGWTKVGRSARLAFVSMLIWMTIHSVFAYWEHPPRPAELRSPKGILMWLSCIMVFVGTEDRAWQLTKKLIYLMVYVSTMILLFNILRLQKFSSYMQVQWFFRGFFNLLLWTAPWMVLSIRHATLSLARTVLVVVPFLTLLLAAILGVGRSWVIITMIYTILVLTKASQELGLRSLAYKWAFYSFFIWIVLILGAASLGPLRSSLSLLSERLLTDTRTAQYVQFFSQVSWFDLLIGKGPRSTWLWYGKPYAWIDGSYTLMAFTGGLPLVLGYLLLMIYPAWQVLRRRPPAEYRACAITLLLWGLALTGLSTFTNPSVSAGHFVLCMYAGRCHKYLQATAESA